MSTKQAHLQAIISAVDRLTPTLNKIGIKTASTKAVLTSLSTVNFRGLMRTTNMVHKTLVDVGGAARNATQQLLPLIGMGGLSVAGIGAGFLVASRGAMAYSAGLQDAVDRTGEGFVSLQKLQGAFRLGGVEAEGTNDAIVKFNQGMANAAAGKDKGFAGLMTRLRIPLRNAKGEVQSLVDVLPDLADAIEKNQNPAVRTRILMELFGKSGSKLAGTLGQGGKSLRELFDELERSGRILSAETGAGLDKMDEQVEELGVQSRVLSAEILGRAAPAMLKLVDRMRGWMSANRELLQQRIGAVVERIANAFTNWVESGGIERLTAGFSQAWGVVSGLVTTLGGLGNTLKLIGLLVVAGPLASLVSLGAAIGRLGIVLVPILARGLLMLLAPLGAMFKALRAGQIVLMGMSLGLGQIALLAAPFLLIAAAVAAAAYLIYGNWDAVGPFLAGVWERMKTPATVAWNVLRFLFSWSPLGIIVNNWQPIVAWASAFWETFKGVVAVGVELVGTLLGDWSPVEMVRQAWDPVLTFLSDVWERIKDIVGPALNFVGGAASAVGNAFTGKFGPQATGQSYGPQLAGPGTTPLMMAGAMQTSARVQGDMRVRFENAPPGMRVEPGTTSSPGLGFSPDVGYRNMGGIG
mgnify:CR=1 FL=1